MPDCYRHPGVTATHRLHRGDGEPTVDVCGPDAQALIDFSPEAAALLLTPI